MTDYIIQFQQKESSEVGEGGNKEAEETAEEGGGYTSPLLPCFSFQKPMRWHKNHVASCSSLFIPPKWQEGIFSHGLDNGAVGYSSVALF